MAKEWRGMLAPLDTSTGDGRRFLATGVTNRPLPLPLKWQRADVSGHDESVIIGSCEAINYGTVQKACDMGWIDPKKCKAMKLDPAMMGVWGSGKLFACNPLETPRLAEDIAECTLLLENGVIGPSVDPGSCDAVIAQKGCDEALSDEQLDALFWGEDAAGEDIELEMLFTSYEIAAATLVGIPAFAQCRPFELMEPALTASVRSEGWASLPFAARNQAWDGPGAEKRVADDSGIGTDQADWHAYAAAFLYVDPAADPQTKRAYKFQIVDLDGGERKIFPRAVFVTAGILMGSMGGTTIPEADQHTMKDIVGGLYGRMADEFNDPGISPPWAVKASAALLAALTAATPTYDPRLFADPQLPAITPLTVTADGRVFGHVATHDVCHVGHRDTCTTAPFSGRDYTDFHRYVVDTDDDMLVTVGRITFGRGEHRCTCGSCRGANDDHACGRLSAGAAIAHHDQLTTVAYVRCGEDEANNAIWVSGVLAPGASPEDAAMLSRGRVSGDWRTIAGQLELVEVLALSRERPGFPLPRVRMDAGRPMALTAAGTVPGPAPAAPAAPAVEIDYERLGLELANRLAHLAHPHAEPAVMALVDVDPGPTGVVDQLPKTETDEEEPVPEELVSATAAAYQDAAMAVDAGLEAVAASLRSEMGRV